MKTKKSKRLSAFLQYQTSQTIGRLFIIIALLVSYTPSSFGQACPTSPICPTDQNLTIRSDNSAPNQWVQSNNLVNNGAMVMVIPPGFGSATFNPWFSPDYQFGVHSGRILQHTVGAYLLGPGNQYNFIGTELGAPPIGKNFTGLSDTWDNYRAVFGLVDNVQPGLRDALLLWQDNNSPIGASHQRLRFVWRDNGSNDYEFASILSSNGNFGINTITPLSKLEVSGGMYVGSGATVTAPSGKLFANGGVFVGDDAFMSTASTCLPSALAVKGFVGIGTNSPCAQLHVQPPSASYSIPGTIAIFDYYDITNTLQEAFRINNATGSVGINRPSPAEKLDVGGNVRIGGNLYPSVDNTDNFGNGTYHWKEIFCTNSTINTSDIKYKTEIKDLDYGLNQIMKLKAISYHWKENDNGRRLGFIAQDVQKIISEVVVEDTDTNGVIRFGMRYTELIPVLVNAVQEQQKIIENYQASVNDLQNKLSDLQKAVESLQNGNLNLKGLNNNSINLYQNEPNPFSNKTTIKYSINTAFNEAHIEIRDINAQLVNSIILGNKQGASSVEFDGSALNKGGYTYSLIVDGKIIDSKKLLLTY